ncbi:MAG: metalloregulator ArsR/SmtB family transcription factor [Nitrospirales bacterium]|nr:winged helix-turn-helix transcriptional regulator [Nitrospira sp.]MDR4500008.1 metalloregulator ArsR/SmtB family transcription factor [Nitrospirales bacterium]
MKTHTETCADKLKVLADTTRLAVLESLMDCPKLVSELLEILRIEQSLLSHHLSQLREAGLVESTREGKAMRYQLAPEVSTASTGKALDLGCCQLSFPSRSMKRPTR